MKNKEQEKDAEWSFDENQIVQLLPAGDWLAVWEVDGERVANPVDFMALYEWVTVYMKRTNGKVFETERSDPFRSVCGVELTDTGFELCCECANFLGMAKQADVETVEYAGSWESRQKLKAKAELDPETDPGAKSPGE